MSQCPPSKLSPLLYYVDEQRYLFAGKQLQDEQRLAACGLTKECIINLVKREAYAQQCLCSLNVDEDICNTPLSAPSGKTTGPSKQQQQAATDNTDTKKAPAPRHQKGAPPVSAPITTEPQSTLLPLHQEDAPAVEVKDVNVEQQRLLSRLVKLCAEFNEEFDWHKYKEIQAIRKTLIAQRCVFTSI